jgi:hypothetical protein
MDRNWLLEKVKGQSQLLDTLEVVVPEELAKRLKTLVDKVNEKTGCEVTADDFVVEALIRFLPSASEINSIAEELPVLRRPGQWHPSDQPLQV